MDQIAAGKQCEYDFVCPAASTWITLGNEQSRVKGRPFHRTQARRAKDIESQASLAWRTHGDDARTGPSAARPSVWSNATSWMRPEASSLARAAPGGGALIAHQE